MKSNIVILVKNRIIIYISYIYDMRTIIYPLTLQSKYYKQLIEMGKIKKGCRILDIGSGTGILGMLLNKLYGDSISYYAIDSGKYVTKASQIKGKSNNGKNKVVRGRIESIPFADNSFDLVYCNLVIHHLAQDVLEFSLDEIKRVLKPKGTLYVFDYCPTRSFVHYAMYIITYIWTSVYENGKVLFQGKMPIYLEENGFKNIKEFPISDLFPLAIYRATNGTIK